MTKSIENPQQPPKLRPKYQLYADSILRGNTQTQAAIDAGYSEKSATHKGYQLSTITHIRSYIAYYMAEQAKANLVSAQDYVPTLREIRDNNKIDRPHVSVSACAELHKIKQAGEGVNSDNRPAFVGIKIDMGKGKVEMISKDGGNNGGNSSTQE